MFSDDAKQPGGGKFLTRDYGEVTYEWAHNHIYDLFWVELPDKAAK